MAARRARRGPLGAKILVGVLVGVPLLAAGAIGLALLFVNPNDFKPQIVAAVKQQTGRDLTLAGPLSLRPSLWPTVEAEDVSLSNVPGGSRPEMVRIRKLEVQAALLPLLERRIVIHRLVLDGPDILLETDASGQGNWRFTPEPAAKPAAPPATPATEAASQPAAPPHISVQDVRIEDGKLTWHDNRAGTTRVFGLRSFELRAPTTSDPVTFSGQAVVADTPVNVSGGTGSFLRLQESGSGSASWPVRLMADAAGAHLSVIGSILRPLAGTGWTAEVEAQAPDLAQIGTLAGQPLPPLHDVALSGRFTDAGTGVPDMEGVSLKLGAADLGSILPGLTLDHADLSVPNMQAPMRAEANAVLRGVPLHATALLGGPALLRDAVAQAAGAQTQPWTFDVIAEAAQARASAKGLLKQPAQLAGLDATLSAQVPDLVALSPLAGTALPAVKDISFTGEAADQDGLRHGVALSRLALTSPVADLDGDAALAFAARPRLVATLTSRRIDAGALIAAIPASSAAPAGAPGSPNPSPPPKPPRTRLIPDTELPFAALGTLDADVQLQVAELILSQMPVRGLATHVVVADGNLHVDPFAATLPAGKMDGRLSVEQGGGAPAVALVLAAPGLQVQSLEQAFGIPVNITGDMKVDADLRGSGRTPHAIASVLSGRLALSMSGGTISSGALGGLLGEVLKTANAPADLLGSGSGTIRCLEVRIDAQDGRAAVSALDLDSARFALQGSGAMNLGEETLALRLRPLLRVGGPGIVVPLRVGGTFLAPKVGVDAGGTAESVAGLLGGLAGGPIGALAGVGSGQKSGGCGGAAASGASSSSAASQGQKLPAAVGNLLKGFAR